MGSSSSSSTIIVRPLSRITTMASSSTIIIAVKCGCLPASISAFYTFEDLHIRTSAFYPRPGVHRLVNYVGYTVVVVVVVVVGSTLIHSVSYRHSYIAAFTTLHINIVFVFRSMQHCSYTTSVILIQN